MVVSVLLGLLAVVSLSEAEIAERAAAAFREGVRLRDDPEEAEPHFRQAAEGYEELRRRGVRNAALFRNQGNAALLAGDLPGAILAYRRGLQQTPHDSDLCIGLAYAREQVAYPPSRVLGRQPEERWPPWLLRWAPQLFLIAALASYVLSCVCLTRWRMKRRPSLLLGGLVALIFAFGAGLVPAADWGLHLLQRREAALHPLVVIAEDGVLLRKGNGFGYPPAHETPLPRGVEARLLFERGDWLQIELAGGEVGWVPAEYTLLDRP